MPTAKPTFESQLAELQTLVTKLQQGDLSLDESIQAFSQGMELSKNLKQQLTTAEHTLAQMVDDDDQVTTIEQAGDDLSNNGVANQGYHSQFASDDDDNPF